MYKNKITSLRNKNILTKQELASILNIDRTTYSHYENEDDIIPLKHLITITDYFNVSIDYIFNFTKNKNYANQKHSYNIKNSSTRLKEFRKEHKLTQTKLGEILNCSYGTIAGYESGRYIIATPFLYDICKKYKISADYLLGKIDEPKYLK
ncbi:MAG: helix-turn-helix domain-containing protein [Bacilli bacterium]|jgi:transcriptional regulator with XRE-family HTH domain|nr:helix-turn-helix domain-containing protein [Bacilli bacterium]MCX4255287.1 helix-turn-helix transcriptional regulator [Bacilli bacterium]